LTGATAGIGLAIATKLLSSDDQHLLFLTGRKVDVLNNFKEQYPDRVITSMGDMESLDYVNAILSDVQLDGKLDGLILNHGTLGNCLRMAQMDAKEWEGVFRINVTSCAVLVSPGNLATNDQPISNAGEQIQHALPLLRAGKGRIVFTSSGAAQNAYSSWGAYGASKAALNHMAMTLKNEEPNVTTIAIRPGVVDTAMQQDIRDSFITNMDDKDRQKFMSAKSDGKLLTPEKPGNVIAALGVSAAKELSGLFLR
jgi:NAD(P)-dependent dehydrogenase (short-subunit alcohol dehydrogenase family)